VWATSPEFLSVEEVARVAGGFAADVDIAAHFGGSTSLMGSYTLFVSGDESDGLHAGIVRLLLF
jgi:hypothetical protein